MFSSLKEHIFQSPYLFKWWGVNIVFFSTIVFTLFRYDHYYETYFLFLLAMMWLKFIFVVYVIQEEKNNNTGLSLYSAKTIWLSVFTVFVETLLSIYKLLPHLVAIRYISYKYVISLIYNLLILFLIAKRIRYLPK